MGVELSAFTSKRNLFALCFGLLGGWFFGSEFVYPAGRPDEYKDYEHERTLPYLQRAEIIIRRERNLDGEELELDEDQRL